MIPNGPADVYDAGRDVLEEEEEDHQCIVACQLCSVYAVVPVRHIETAVNDSSAVMKWSVASRPAGLSVNRAHNLVVACRDKVTGIHNTRTSG